MASQFIMATRLRVQNSVQTSKKVNTKAFHYWPFMWGIQRVVMNSPHKQPVMRKGFPCYYNGLKHPKVNATWIKSRKTRMLHFNSNYIQCIFRNWLGKAIKRWIRNMTYSALCWRPVIDVVGIIRSFCISNSILIPSWIGNYIRYKVWGEITYLFPNFTDTDATVEFGEWISNFISFHIHGGMKVKPC